MLRLVALYHLILAVLPPEVLPYAHDKGTLLRGTDRAPMRVEAAGGAEVEGSLRAAREQRGNHPLLDYVVPTKDLDCVVRATLESLHRHASVRRVLLVAPASTCKVWQAERRVGDKYPETMCVPEDTVVPDVSYASVEAIFDDKFGKGQDQQQFGWGQHSLTGWYLQQFLKMGIVEAAGRLNLTKDFVVWDSDMVLVHNFAPFDDRDQTNFMEDGNRRNEGCNTRYEASFRQLTHLPYGYSQQGGTSFTSHHMVVHTDYMLELLGRLGSSGQHWTKAIIEAACPDLETCKCGFSEYGAYASWVKHQHPDIMVEVPKGFQRLQVGRDACCPQDSPGVLEGQPSNVSFVGFERIGCK